MPLSARASRMRRGWPVFPGARSPSAWRSSRLEPDGHREVHAGSLELFGISNRRSVHFEVLEQNWTDALPHHQPGLGRLIERAVLENEIRQGHLAAVDVNVPAVILERAVDESEVVQNRMARFGAGRIPPPCKIRRRQLNPDRKLIMRANEVHIFKAQVLDR